MKTWIDLVPQLDTILGAIERNPAGACLVMMAALCAFTIYCNRRPGGKE